MSDCTERRICLRFCFSLGKTATEAYEMLQKAFKEKALSRTQVFEWFARFKRGEISVEAHPHSGLPSTSHTDDIVETIQEKIIEDRRYTINDNSEATGMNWSSCQWIWTVDLNMRRVAAKFVPRLLTQDQQTTRLTLWRQLKNRIESEQNFLKTSRATKFGAMGTTLKPNKFRANGRRQFHWDRRKQDK